MPIVDIAPSAPIYPEFPVPFPEVVRNDKFDAEEGALVSQAPATPLGPDSSEQDKDLLGYTHPNLHRRIQDKLDRDRGHSYDINVSPQEIEDYNMVLSALPENDYYLEIRNVCSYRTTEVYLHDDNLKGGPGSGETEIP